MPVDEAKVTMKGRLGPGMMIAADLVNGQVGTWPVQILVTLFLNRFLLFT